jgi:lipid-A-disaccharide synthase
MSPPPRIWFVAAEASGDLLARETIAAVRARVPGAVINGIGGAEMAAVGVTSPIDVSPLAVLGLLEGLKAYGTAVRLADAATDLILADPPDAVVLFDSWGLMLRVAQRIRARAPGVKLIKLIGPQVWASRAGRARTLAATVDHLLCMHEIETAFYKPLGLPVTVVGNPALSRFEKGDGARFRVAYNIAPDAPVVLVMPGSRPAEIKRVAPALIAAALRLKANDPRREIVIAPASSIAAAFAARFEALPPGLHIVDDPAARFDAMAAATVALACSGTVTSEIAMQRTPMIVTYRTGWITWAIARGFLYKKRHITLLNIVSDDTEIVPEFVQTRQRPELIAAQAELWLSDPAARARQISAQNAALARMQTGGKPAAEIAADVILKLADASPA